MGPNWAHHAWRQGSPPDAPVAAKYQAKWCQAKVAPTGFRYHDVVACDVAEGLWDWFVVRSKLTPSGLKKQGDTHNTSQKHIVNVFITYSMISLQKSH